MSYRYLVGSGILTAEEIATFFGKTAEELNMLYDSGKPIIVSGVPIERTDMTDMEHPCSSLGGRPQGSDGSIFCPIGIPIDLAAFRAATLAKKK